MSVAVSTGVCPFLIGKVQALSLSHQRSTLSWQLHRYWPPTDTCEIFLASANGQFAQFNLPGAFETCTVNRQSPRSPCF